MKKVVLWSAMIGLAVMISANVTLAGCLDGVSTATYISSKVKQVYISTAGSSQYIVLDPATCTVTAGTDAIGSNTKTNYYLYLNDADKAMMATLLMAYSIGDKVQFRVGPISSGYNQILYIMSPVN
jgi:hypothetical protein